MFQNKTNTYGFMYAPPAEGAGSATPTNPPAEGTPPPTEGITQQVGDFITDLATPAAPPAAPAAPAEPTGEPTPAATTPPAPGAATPQVPNSSTDTGTGTPVVPPEGAQAPAAPAAPTGEPAPEQVAKEQMTATLNALNTLLGTQVTPAAVAQATPPAAPAQPEAGAQQPGVVGAPVQPPVSPPSGEPAAAPVKYDFKVDQDTFDNVMAKPEGLADFANQIAEKVHNQAYEAARTDLLQQVTPLIQQNVQAGVVRYSAANDFWKNNTDLLPIHQVVTAKANSVAAQHPEWPVHHVFAQTGKEVRAAIATLNQQKNQQPAGSQFAPPPGPGSTGAGAAPKLSGQAAEIQDLL